MPDRRDALRRARLLNPRAHKVRAPLFERSSFFDADDKLQVKYEMLRSHEVDRVAIGQVAAMFGYSRQGFYQLLEAFRAAGMAGLLEKKRGRKGPVKCTPTVVAYLVAQVQANPELTGRELTERLQSERGIDVHKRTVEKVLAGLERPRRRRRKKPQREER